MPECFLALWMGRPLNTSEDGPPTGATNTTTDPLYPVFQLSPEQPLSRLNGANEPSCYEQTQRNFAHLFALDHHAHPHGLVPYIR